MKFFVLISLIIALTITFPSSAHAYCEVEQDGNIYCSDRGYVGEVEKDGSVYTYDKGYTGVEVEKDGSIYNPRKGYIGEVDRDGDVYDSRKGYNPSSSWIYADDRSDDDQH